MVSFWGRRKIFGFACMLAILAVAGALSVNEAEGKSDKMKIDILSAGAGGTTYVICYALGDLITKHSTWLAATVQETKGSVENMRTLATEPGRRKHTISQNTLVVKHQSKVADRPFKQPYSAKIISRLFWSALPITTLNPKIKTIPDLVGKKFALHPPGSAVRTWIQPLLKYGYGIWDQIIPEALGFGPGKDALLDGLVDAACQPSNVSKPGKTVATPEAIVPGPSLREIIDRRKPYFVNVEEGAVRKAREATGYPLYRVVVPAGSFGPNQSEPFGAPLFSMIWEAPVEMDDKVVYEIVRIIYKYNGKFKDYHAVGKSFTPESLGMVAGTTEEDFHPGAVKFYKEQNVQIGD